MSGASSRPAEWWSALEPVRGEFLLGRGDPEDPRLADVARALPANDPKLRAGQPVLIGFPCDEGVRRNHGRPGAAQAPDSIREFLYRMTATDVVAGIDLSSLGLLDAGNVCVDGGLEQSQERLGEVVAGVLDAGAIPIVLGGGHETAYGHYLGYVGAKIECAILNIDAHLDVRSYAGGGHSGSPFRQAMEHAAWPLKAGRYAVIGAQRQSVAAAHARFVVERHGRVHWLPRRQDGWPLDLLRAELERLAADCPNVLLTVDADAFRQSDVPGTSAPSPAGIKGRVWPEAAYLAGCTPCVRSIDVVEINPNFDRDGQSARWAALGIRQFLVGLATGMRGNAKSTT
jgi:formiminoglutamase